jgi:E3 ubiquitin-protein ligase HUWE1
LDPLLTLQQWAKEIKILHDDFVVECISKLANHVALALLPAAVKAAKEAKVLEEREAEESVKAEAAEAAAATVPDAVDQGTAT